jgi:hypothetical protein
MAAFDPKTTFLQDLQKMAFEFIEISNQATDNLACDERQALNITHGPENVLNEKNRLVQTKKLFHGLLRKDLEKLLTICTQESHFQFNGIFYDQIDGVAMESPLRPLFANAFMSNFERKHKEKLNELGVTHWWRYLDDVFATFKEVADPQTLLDYHKKQHKNIKFLCFSAFDSYRTTIYRKKTFTGVYLK